MRRPWSPLGHSTTKKKIDYDFEKVMVGEVIFNVIGLMFVSVNEQ
jgi:hypothetical protein